MPSVLRRTKTRRLGLDIGDQKIGVALSDPGGVLASPFTIIRYQDEEQALRAIIGIIDQQQVGQIVAGLPLSKDGTIGHQAEKVQAFIGKLTVLTDVPLEFRDESLTTVEAQERLREASPKKSVRKIKDDAAAAAIILQRYLEELK